MSAKMKEPERRAVAGRMAEYLNNWQAEKAAKTPVVGNGRAKYDWGAKARTRAERAAHKKSFGLSSKARENFDTIFRKP